MFEISGEDISKLGDSDLRSLVARLAIAELRAKGYPRSSVTAGGHQDAPDGGLDVRVECPSEVVDPDFVPRRLTGFQCKKPDMPPSAIDTEMRPKGVLRDVILELSASSGAYVIVSSQGSVADKSLSARRKAMRDALTGVPNAAQLHTDFYDRERLANWVNEFPGCIVWVRGKIGRPLSGWSGVGDWNGSVNTLTPYLSNDKACLIDERSREREHLTIMQGVARLRAGLSKPRQCIRLVGLSGNGKTRLIQALFEEGVGEDPLDLSLAVYTDYSSETVPTARDMARDLIAHRQRAILVVDNCNPATHAELASLCSSEASEVSLITVEYDVRDDEPERTDVFRLESASPELVTEWIKQNFPGISQIDREKIAEFSDGNFRVARALAETLRKGETLGSLKSRELFERIFRQRQDPDNQLLRAAEDLALLYSIEGEDVSDGCELAHVGTIRSIGPIALYEALNEMRQRGVVQARGRFRAILPQAIANPLAAHALDRIPTSHFDGFCKTLTARMLRSVSRRLGFLHDSTAAQATVTRWLLPDGPLGDLFSKGDEGYQIISNIAPVVPERVLERLEHELVGRTDPPKIGAKRYQWINLIKAIGYEAEFFDRAATLIALILSARPKEGSNDSLWDKFSELFHISLSGTKATPEQRRALVRKLATSDDERLRHCGQIALRALLKSNHFSSMGNQDFGARSRDWGWYPKINGDIWDWFEESIKLTLEIAPETEARVILAAAFRGLWRYPSCRVELDRAASFFAKKGPWVEGWLASRAALRYDGKGMNEEARAKLEQLIKRLKPKDLLNRARAVVLNRMPGGGGWDIADGEDDGGDGIKAYKKADIMARDVGFELASDAAVRREFLEELMREQHAQRAFECGQGMAQGAEDLEVLWLELAEGYRAAKSETRNATALGGFICEAHHRDQNCASTILEAVINDAELLPILPYLQARVGIDAEGIARLRRAISNGKLAASYFSCIANGTVAESPPDLLAALLEDIAQLSKGVEIALEILHMHLYCNREKVHEPCKELVSLGRVLLARADFAKGGNLRDYVAHTIIETCLHGEEGQSAAEQVCSNIYSAINDFSASSHDLNYTLNALFHAQPLVALNIFLLPKSKRRNRDLFDDDFETKSPIESLDPEVLNGWLSVDPDIRYPQLGKCLNMFIKGDGDDEKDLSPLFISVLEQAPDKRLFFGDIWQRLHPRSWGGSLADILIRRKAKLGTLAEHPDKHIQAFVAEVIPELDRWIQSERGRDRASEESFE